MPEIIEVNPFRCRAWHMHERLEEHLSEKSCDAEIRSFGERGQLIPAIGRRLSGDPSFDIEIICGLRRMFVARHLNMPLSVEVREMSDVEGLIAMDVENRQRKEISPYERGLSYARWLRTAHFESQEELARTLKISASQVSRLLKLARLPSVIVDAFGSAADIHECWGGELADALEDSHKRQALINSARKIAAVSPRPSAREVYKQLVLATSHGRKARASSHDEVVVGDDGLALFRVRHHMSTVALILPLDKVSARSLQAIQSAVAGILKESPAASPTSADRSGRRSSIAGCNPASI